MQPKVAVLGVGAVGGYVAACFAKEGIDVVGIDAWPEHVIAIRRNGLEVKGVNAEDCFRVPVKILAISDVEQLRKSPIDIAFVATKSYDTAWAGALLRDYLAPGGVVVSLQNGLNEATLAQQVGWGRVLGCVIHRVIVELSQPGIVRRGVPKGGDGAHAVFRLGEIHGGMTRRAERAAELLASVDSTIITSNLWGERWAKLAANSMQNGLTAAAGVGFRQLAEDRMLRRFAIAAGRETATIATAWGYEVPSVMNIPIDVLLDSGNEACALAEAERILIALTANVMADARPSLAQDIAKGRRTEIDGLNGAVVAHADDIGLAAPCNRAIVKLVRGIECDAVPVSPAYVAQSWTQLQTVLEESVSSQFFSRDTEK